MPQGQDQTQGAGSGGLHGAPMAAESWPETRAPHLGLRDELLGFSDPLNYIPDVCVFSWRKGLELS